jgi:hypothetical protein
LPNVCRSDERRKRVDGKGDARQGLFGFREARKCT